MIEWPADSLCRFGLLLVLQQAQRIGDDWDICVESIPSKAGQVDLHEDASSRRDRNFVVPAYFRNTGRDWRIIAKANCCS